MGVAVIACFLRPGWEKNTHTHSCGETRERDKGKSVVISHLLNGQRGRSLLRFSGPCQHQKGGVRERDRCNSFFSSSSPPPPPRSLLRLLFIPPSSPPSLPPLSLSPSSFPSSGTLHVLNATSSRVSTSSPPWLSTTTLARSLHEGPKT